MLSFGYISFLRQQFRNNWSICLIFMHMNIAIDFYRTVVCLKWRTCWCSLLNQGLNWMLLERPLIHWCRKCFSPTPTFIMLMGLKKDCSEPQQQEVDWYWSVFIMVTFPQVLKERVHYHFRESSNQVAIVTDYCWHASFFSRFWFLCLSLVLF